MGNVLRDRLDPATTPVLDAHLGDGSRVAICVPPASPHVAITSGASARDPFRRRSWSSKGALPEHIRHAAERTPPHAPEYSGERRHPAAARRRSSMRSSNSSPPTSGSSPSRTRSSCGIDSPNCVRFEARGLQTGAVTIRDLVKHALRHRPDHIVVGEVRGGEAADLLQALNTGHGGSLTTVHANNAESALSRLASCAMQGGGDLPWEVTCRGRGGRDRHGDPHDPRRRPALRNWKSGPDSATKMEISDSFAGRSALALSFVPIRRGDHARCT